MLLVCERIQFYGDRHIYCTVVSLWGDHMRTRTKILLGIIALITIGSFLGKNSKPEEMSVDEQQSNVVIDEYEQNASLTTIVEEESQQGEITDNDHLADNETIDLMDTGNLSEDDNADISKQLEVHYIDVGQGDATLIVCDDEAMLVDAGDEGKGTAIQLYLKKA